MGSGYKILICGAQPGHGEEQVAAALAPILKRAPADLLPALRSKQAITLTLSSSGPGLVAARGLKETIEKTGCVCRLDSLDGPPPKLPWTPGSFGGARLRPFANRTVGLVLNAPTHWRDVSDADLFRIHHSGTSTYFTSSRNPAGGARLPVWAEIRFGVIHEQMSYLKPHRPPYSLDTAAGPAIAAEFRGVVPNDDKPTHQLVLCLQPDDAAVSFSITATVPEFEQHQAFYQWLLRTQLQLHDGGGTDVAAARMGHDHPEEQYDIAVKFAKAGQHRDAVEWFRKAAQQGHAQAQFEMGCYCQRGDAFPQDAPQAFEWWRKAAEQGVMHAQFNLANAYGMGFGTAPDPAKAFHWLHKAAEQGDADAQHKVAICYIRGNGVAENSKMAGPWALKAAEQGHPQAQFLVGAMHERGEGLLRDPQRAVFWYRKAAEGGEAQARQRLHAMGL